MKKYEALKELEQNINLNFAHAVLLKNKKNEYRTELHSGHAGNCCCAGHQDFVWREELPYTDPEEIQAI